MHTIRLAGDPVLRTPTEPVTEFGRDLRVLVDRMFDAMYTARGVGLAANQIGVNQRVFVYDLADGRRGHLVNPVLTELDAEALDTDVEGCLSIPGRYYPTPRAATATARGVDLTGEPLEISGDGQLARCLQHEIDHLDGVLYLDHLSREVRRQAYLALDNSDAFPGPR